MTHVCAPPQGHVRERFGDLVGPDEEDLIVSEDSGACVGYDDDTEGAEGKAGGS